MKNLLSIIICVLCAFPVKSQYISRSQPVPFSCPTVCPGSIIVLDVPQVQNLNAGDTVQAWLSNNSGSFSSGTTVLTPIAYSLNTGTNWINGPYLYSASVNNLYIQVIIPAGLPAGSRYTILMKSSSGFVASDYFSCSGTDSITVTPAYPTLGNLPITAEGTNQWVGHVYTWVSTTSQSLFTTALVDSQDFYNTANYQGYFLKDSLGFDINYLTASGGTCPGQPGVLNDGTNIPCSKAFSTDFSIRLLRKQNFATGTYRFTIQGDDGIRLSIDGGNTWLLSSFFEQVYSNSFKTTDSLYPNGICLSGATDLVIEFFQRNVDSRLTFTSTLLSGGNSVTGAGNQTVCPNGNTSFKLSETGNLTYQWYYSANNGASFSQVPNSSPFSGATTDSLGISNVPSSYNNYLFYCSIIGICSNAVNTPTDTLFVGGFGNPITITPTKTSICPHNDSATICAAVNYTTYLWSNGATGYCITTDTAGDYQLTVSYRGGCSSSSNTVHISVYPVITPTIHQSGSALSTATPGSSYQWHNSSGPLSGDTSSSMVIQAPGSYYITMLDSDGCPEQSTPIVAKITGLNEISSQPAFSIYPNPASQKCFVSVTGSTNIKELFIYNSLGQLVMLPITINGTTEIDMHNLSGGIYFFKLGNEVKKVIKE